MLVKILKTKVYCLLHHTRILIEQLKNLCNENLCPLQCRICNVCGHSYQFSCIDSRVYLNICKHIHKIGASRISETPIENEYQNEFSSIYSMGKRNNSYYKSFEASGNHRGYNFNIPTRTYK